MPTCRSHALGCRLVRTSRGFWSRPIVLVFILLFPAFVRSADDRPITLVGMRGHISDVVIPGPELEVRPLDSQAPFVLRIVSVKPHGNAFRYEFEYYALEARTYDLARYLRSRDGRAAAKLPSIEVEVKGLLAPGVIHPHSLEAGRTSWLAGYRLLLVVGAVVWVLGLFLILLWGRRRKLAKAEERSPEPTVAERLRPLVVQAMAGVLTTHERAELERTLLAFWRERLGLENEKASVALAKMRSHPEAGLLLNQLELWLHRPGTAEQVELGRLLWPYQLPPKQETAGTRGTNGVLA
jgi:hypothetical protein